MAGKSKRTARTAAGVSWALIVVLFAIGAWPIALILLLVKALWKRRTGKTRQAPPPLSREPCVRQMPEAKDPPAGPKRRSATQ